MAERKKKEDAVPPSDFASGVPPTDLNSGGDIRMLLKQMTDLNQRFDEVAKPPMFRLADMLGLVAAILALAVFAVSSFALSDRIERSELRVTRAQERLDDRLAVVQDDVSEIKTSVAVLTETKK